MSASSKYSVTFQPDLHEVSLRVLWKCPRSDAGKSNIYEKINKSQTKKHFPITSTYSTPCLGGTHHRRFKGLFATVIPGCWGERPNRERARHVTVESPALASISRKVVGHYTSPRGCLVAFGPPCLCLPPARYKYLLRLPLFFSFFALCALEASFAHTKITSTISIDFNARPQRSSNGPCARLAHRGLHFHPPSDRGCLVEALADHRQRAFQEVDDPRGRKLRSESMRCRRTVLNEPVNLRPRRLFSSEGK